MQNFWEDIRFGIRLMLKKPAFSIIAVVTLALGIGANTAIFSVVNGVLLRSLPYDDPDRLVMIWESNARSNRIHVSNPNFIDWRDQSQSFEAFSAYTGRWGGPSTITGGAEPVRAYAVGVFRDFFSVMGARPLLGRVFRPEEHSFGAEPGAVVSYAFWQRSLGADANLSDKRLTIDGKSFSVIGVMPAGFSFPPDTDLWLAKEQLFNDTSARSSHNYQVIARLKQSVTLGQAQTEMSTIARQLEQQYPDSNTGAGAAVISLEDQVVGPVRPALLILLGAVAFVLLIACANVANLLLARALARQKEIAIRSALGASRLRIIRQLLTESLMLSLLGGTLGLALAFWMLDVLIALSPGNIPRINEVTIDLTTLAFTLALSVVTSMLFGLAPALRISRPDLQQALKEGGRSSASGSSSQWLRSLLVVGEVALTVVLLIGAGLLTKSFWRLLQVSPGFDTQQVLTMQVSLPSSEYKEERQTIAFYRQLLSRIETVPGVEAAGAINNLPLAGVNINGAFFIEGRGEETGYGGFRIISPNYFRAMSIPLLKGRAFTEADNENAPPVAVIDQSAAGRTWPGEDPLGKRIKSPMDPKADVWMTIVGVVGDVKHSGLDARVYPAVYVPYAQRPARARELTVVARTSGMPGESIPAIREQVQAVDKNLPVSFEPMKQLLSRSVADRRYNMLLLAAFAVVATALAMIGIYGVMSYWVTESTREIGIRLALGAQSRDVLKLIVGNGMTLTLIGLAIGIGASIALTRLLASMLFGVSATDLTTFVVVSLALATVAMLASYIPARRAMKVDPMVALRYE